MHVEILIFLGLYDKVFQSLKKTIFSLCVCTIYVIDVFTPIFSFTSFDLLRRSEIYAFGFIYICI